MCGTRSKSFFLEIKNLKLDTQLLLHSLNCVHETTSL